MPTKNTTVLAVRVKNETISKIKDKASKRGISINAWLSWAIGLGLRKHRK